MDWNWIVSIFSSGAFYLLFDGFGVLGWWFFFYESLYMQVVLVEELGFPVDRS